MSLFAATAWLAPFPPWAKTKVPPVTVSPGGGEFFRLDDHIHVDTADDDDGGHEIPF